MASMVEQFGIVGVGILGGLPVYEQSAVGKVFVVGIVVLAQVVHLEQIYGDEVAEPVAVGGKPAHAVHFVDGKKVVVVWGVVRHSEVLRLQERTV